MRRIVQDAEGRARAAGLAEVRLYTHELMTENRAHHPRRGSRETHRQTQDQRTRVFFDKVLPAAPGGPGTVGGGP